MKRPVKRILCLLLFCALVMSLASCGTKDSFTQKSDGKFYDQNNNVVANENVTLDFLSQYHHGKDFNDLNETALRQEMIDEYLSYHLPAGAETTQLLNQLSGIDISSLNLPSNAELGLEQIDGFLGEASTLLSMADFYAQVIEDDEFGDFIEELGSASEVAGTALNIGKAYFLMTDLANNDIANKEEYCTDLIDALSFVTSFVPVFDEYFGESLSIVKEGVKIVIKNDTIHQNTLDAYGQEIGRTSFFSRSTDYAEFAFIVDPSKWEFEKAPTIADIFAHRSDFATMTAKDLTYLREYLLFRISYEMQHPDKRGSERPEQPDPNTSCAHVYQGSVTKKATCTEDGVKTFKCDRKCGSSYTESIPATGHSYEDTVVAPTYEAQGYTEHTCTRCGDSYKDSFVDPLDPLPDLSNGSAWSGYEVDPPFYPKRFDITIEEMTEDHISGFLDASVLYESTHQTAFEGTGSFADGIITYTLHFETPAILGTIPTFEYDTITMYYDPATDCFTFDGCYEVQMNRVSQDTPPTLEENATWSGLAEDNYYSHICQKDHQYVLNISSMNQKQISGHFTLSYNDNVDHDSEFVGRGFRVGDQLYYEIQLLTPRTEKNILEITVDAFILIYDFESDTFTINGFYSAELERQ